MKRYIKTIENISHIKYGKDIIIYKNNKQIINPTEDLILSDGWVEYVPAPVILSDDEILKREKEILIDKINSYDSSEYVNGFYVGEVSVWLDKTTRVGLKLRFDAEIASGKTNTILWYEGNQFPLTLENALMMLNAIELYASACYDNTQAHIANVKKAQNITELKNYDYTSGYPSKLRF
jgi:hypothetical protein